MPCCCIRKKGKEHRGFIANIIVEEQRGLLYCEYECYATTIMRCERMEQMDITVNTLQFYPDM